MSLGLFVERLRREVDATGPHHGPCFRIDRGLRKVGRVVQRLEYQAVDGAGHLGHALQAEGQGLECPLDCSAR